jgi:dTDP-4-dehydrorhamnose reductase
MSRILITGAGGRLGAALARAWSAGGEGVLPFGRAELDLAQPETLRQTLEAADFDVLVNCAALTNVDYCEQHPEEAHRINGEAVRTMAEVCTRKGARCIHISTDYVFDGAKREPYLESDAAEPISHYGASKLAGECALLETSADHLAVRVSWVFGPDRPSFIDQMLMKARQDESAAAIADKWAVPTYTEDVPTLLHPFLRERRIGGTLHLCNGGGCTWQEYGQHALDYAHRLRLPLRARTVAPLQMAELKAFIANRPPYTVMSTAKLTALGGAAPRPWQEAVEAYIREHLRARLA